MMIIVTIYADDSGCGANGNLVMHDAVIKVKTMLIYFSMSIKKEKLYDGVQLTSLNEPISICF